MLLFSWFIFKVAAVLPLGMSTAACALFMKEALSCLDLPSLHPQPKIQTRLVWGGSTSVGCNAIQLAKAAGYDVTTTASPKNQEYLKRLGASEAYDYNSHSVAADIVKALQGCKCVGALSIGKGTLRKCIEIFGATKSSSKNIALCTLGAAPFLNSVFRLSRFPRRHRLQNGPIASTRLPVRCQD